MDMALDAPGPSTSNANNLPSLNALYEQSKRLNAAQQRGFQGSGVAQQEYLPLLDLGLDQIEAQSRKLAQRARGEGLSRDALVSGAPDAEDQLARAQYMLASAKVDTSQLTRNLNALQPASAFTPLEPHTDTDIGLISRQAHQSILVSCIEEGRRQTVHDFYAALKQNMVSEWERKKSSVFDQLNKHHPALMDNSQDAMAVAAASSSSTAGGAEAGSPRRRSSMVNKQRSGETYYASGAQLAPGSELAMHNKMMRYDAAVHKLNAARAADTPISASSLLAEAALSSGLPGVDSRALPLGETYALLSSLVGEGEDGASLREGQYAKAYHKVGIDAESQDAAQLRRTIVEGGRSFLQNQFRRHVEATIQKSPSKANLGGDPSMQNHIRAYVQVLYQSDDGSYANNLELLNHQPFFARCFFLIRAGHIQDALDLATSPEYDSLLKTSEPNFVTYLQAWAHTYPAHKPLNKNMRERFHAEYTQRLRSLSLSAHSQTDPFKIALYKLFGRADLAKKNVAGVTDKTEHWLWLQLALIREEPVDNIPAAPAAASSNALVVGGSSGGDKYGLRDFAAVLRKFGEKHWDPKSNRPGLYFQVLLLSGQFERAIAFLHARPAHRTDAIHFAVALRTYGLLKVLEQSQAPELDLLKATTDQRGYEVCYINFPRMIHRYYLGFARADPTHALGYICLLSLSLAEMPSDLKTELRSIMGDYVKELVVESKAYSALLGTLDAQGSKTPGAIMQNAKLLDVEDDRRFIQTLVQGVVRAVDSDTKFNDSILLYNTAEDYNGVLEVLNNELGACLSQHSANASSDVLQVAQSVYEHYQNTGVRLDRKRTLTLNRLIKLNESLAWIDAGRLDDALVALESVHVVPLDASGDVVSIMRSAEEFKDLDAAIVRNFDAILLSAMDVLHKLYMQLKESPYGDNSRQNRMAEIKKKSRTLMMFAGMLRYRLSAETYHNLSRQEIFIA